MMFQENRSVEIRGSGRKRLNWHFWRVLDRGRDDSVRTCCLSLDFSTGMADIRTIVNYEGMVTRIKLRLHSLSEILKKKKNGLGDGPFPTFLNALRDLGLGWHMWSLTMKIILVKPKKRTTQTRKNTIAPGLAHRCGCFFLNRVTHHRRWWNRLYKDPFDNFL